MFPAIFLPGAGHYAVHKMIKHFYDIPLNFFSLASIFFVYINSHLHHHHFTIFFDFSEAKVNSRMLSKCNFRFYVLAEKEKKEKSLGFMSMKSSGKIAKQHEVIFIVLICWWSPICFWKFLKNEFNTNFKIC